ncbi:hybrid sensor histidine kinase/response regulator [Chitinophaga silvatica]|uniref:histidine kinase n=1 Tax=Chitinophaga silvatica TaxID=2282649 RepID=A0A3E1Y6Y9_9BACT|nr:two-component regulator propeller domain-containing protein [Chitinophaga silvatica]RFS20705.1 hybrid sensor histidine kinase/response regulator [Chitinophaga silvatica]
MPFKCRVGLFLLILLLPIILVAQPRTYNFSRLDTDNGLSHNQVYTIYRDNTGFVWFGGAAGLNRFDGHNCKIFTNIPSDTTSLEDSFITDLFPFPGNKMWVGSKSLDAVAIYNPLTEQFDRHYTRYLKTMGLPAKRAICILLDRQKNYWFLFEKEGLFRFNPASRQVQSFKAPESSFTSMCEDVKGNIWLVLKNGKLLQLDGRVLTPLQENNKLQELFKGKAYDYRLYADKGGNIWAYTFSDPVGLLKINPHTNETIYYHSNSPYPLNNNLIKGIVEDKYGDIWVGTDHGGINVIDALQPAHISYVLNREDDKKSLSYNSIETLYKDNQGIIWIGAGKKGVNYIDQQITQFELYCHEPDNKTSLPDNDINCFAEDAKGNVWIGTNGGGLIYFDTKTRKFTQYLNNPSDPYSLSNNVIVSLCVDHSGKVWVGTFLGGLNVFDGKQFTVFRHDSSDPYSLSDDRVWHLMEDRNNVIWVGTLLGGVNRYDHQTNRFYKYAVESPQPLALHSNYIPSMLEDSKGNLWIGTSEGVEVLNPERTAFTHYNHSNDPNSLTHSHIRDLVEDQNGLVWVATRVGLNVWNPRTKKFKRFTTEDGLPDNTILSLLIDKHNNAWMTTSKGLCQLLIKRKDGDVVALEVRNFNNSNNIQGKIFNESAAMLSKSGLIYEGGANGFNIINPDKVDASEGSVPLVFTNIDIFNNEINVGQLLNRNVVLTEAIPFTSEIKLRHNENIFSIEFAALDFSGNNLYAYKLEGLNTQWSYTTSANRKVTYTNLAPGTYYFKVKATNGDGIWGNNEKTLKVVITPVFWKTPLAFIIYAVAILALLYLARSYIIEKERMRFAVVQERTERERVLAMDTVKTKLFTNVSHEFRTPLNLILGPLDKMLQTISDPAQQKQLQLIHRNGKRLLNLVNQLLDFRKMEVQEFKLQPTEGEVVHCIQDICNSFSDVAERQKISLLTHLPQKSLRAFFDWDKLEKILFNLLSNAFKYTSAGGSITVNVVETGGDTISISVADTGMGIPKDKQERIFERFFQQDVPANIMHPGTGIGLAITKEFVKLHNGTITVESEPEKGATFTIVLPLIQPEAEEIKAENKAKESRSQNRPVILLVEDNDDFRFYLKDNLKQDYEVIECANGQEAWEDLDKWKPDLVVSDVMMPFMDGIELTRRIKTHPTLSSVPIILLTAVGDEEMQLESYKLGVSDYMTKPFTYEILASRMKNLIALAKVNGKKQKTHLDLQPSEVAITPVDEQFLQQVLSVLEKNIANAEFTVEELSKELYMHRAGMYRKLLSLTGRSPQEFIRDIRLKRGKQLLERSQLTIAEVAYEVGFNNPKKFSMYFKETFGITPSQFQKQAARV